MQKVETIKVTTIEDGGLSAESPHPAHEPHSGALPGCATPRLAFNHISIICLCGQRALAQPWTVTIKSVNMNTLVTVAERSSLHHGNAGSVSLS